MIIELASVGVLPKELKVSFAPEEIDLDDEAELETGVGFVGEAFQANGKVQVAGRISAQIKRCCTRCLEPVTKPLELDVKAVFIDAANEDLNAEREVTGEELDESLVIGGEIDLSEVVREQILLALPEQVYCGDGCKGLCPKCGANRNLIDCKCDNAGIDPRWAALKNLR